MWKIKEWFLHYKEAIRISLLALFRWTLLAVCTGVLCGGIGTLFHLAVEWVTEQRTEQVWLLWLLPAAGIAITALYKVTGCVGKGTNDVLRAVQDGSSVTPWLVPAIFLGTVLTHLCGGSAGREGAALQMGGSIGWNIGRVLHFNNHDCRTATVCGMAAFFSALFGTPLTATLFAMMVVDVGLMLTVAFVPGFLAALIAYGISLKAGTVDRLNQALGRKEHIMVYGDYDVDGCTAVALVYKFLSQFYSNIDFYIPDRYEEGYGISRKGIDFAAEMGVKLIIVLDCGIKAVEEVAYAREKGIDFIIVRELIGGVYFGSHETHTLENGEKQAIDSMPYSEHEIERIGRIGFETARKRRKKLCCVDKANVLDTSRLWRSVMHRLQAEYPDVEYSEMFVDNCAMQIVKNPAQFDVIVTENMFGDILSDEASMITGSIGMIPSSSLGDGTRGLYEPIHGSAPDIAGKDIVNPTACILSAAMMLRYSFGLTEEADAIENAVNKVLDKGLRTADNMSEGCTCLGCTAMGDAILAEI